MAVTSQHGPRTRAAQRVLIRYILAGILFGWCFPIVAWLLALSQAEGTWTAAGLWRVHMTNHVLLIVDLAPMVLGVMGYMVGRKQRQLLQREQQHFESLVLHSSDMITIVEPDGAIRYGSPSLQRVLGYRPDELAGQSAYDLVHPDDGDDLRAFLATAIEQDEATAPMEWRVRYSDGSWRYVESIGTNLLHDPTVRGVVLNSRDVSERKRLEEQLIHQARHDALTDLPNRLLLHDRLSEVLCKAHQEHELLALLLLDLDRFKEVNDTLGHHYGDLLLQQVGILLRSVLRPHDTVARLGGDEFALLLPGSDSAAAESVARRILSLLAEPIVVEDRSLHVGASIGMALCPEHGTDAQTLLQRADVAMYVAKRTHCGCTLYTATQDQHSPDRLALSNALHHAIVGNELRLHYQPKVDCASGEVCGVEALVRWQHPEQGLIPPDQFISLAEGSGLIGPLTVWVLETALRQCRTWHDAGQPLTMSVNLSMHTVHDNRLPEMIAGLLARYGVSPDYLVLELTESALMLDPAGVLDVLARLSTLGVRIAIDDFGTGYSSLSYLKRLPVHEVKIDKSFVFAVQTDGKDAAIVRSVVAMAHALGMEVVAEGVENEEAWHMLRALGCDVAQGYHLSRPLPLEDLDRWLNGSSWACRSSA